jgi:hypothetical protein
MASAILTMVAGTWIGLRLYSLSRRTGQAPERYIGIGMLAFGAVAYPLFLTLVAASGSLPRPTLLGITFGANSAYLVCLVMIAMFTRIVFRPTSGWGAVLVGLIALIGLTGSGLSLWNSYTNPGAAHVFDPLGRWGTSLISAAFALCFLWTSSEAFAYRSSLRRRLALGLADPVVVNRFSIWAFGTAVAFVTDLALVASNAIGLNPAENPIPALLQSTSGLSCTITWTLTFAPSEAYLNWVRKRAGGATS